MRDFPRIRATSPLDGLSTLLYASEHCAIGQLDLSFIQKHQKEADVLIKCLVHVACVQRQVQDQVDGKAMRVWRSICEEAEKGSAKWKLKISLVS